MSLPFTLRNFPTHSHTDTNSLSAQHVDDTLGRLCITDAGLMRRELMVLDTCLAAGVPTAGCAMNVTSPMRPAPRDSAGCAPSN